MPASAISVVQIPVEQLLPNPDQPRQSFEPGSIEAIAASLKARGQDTPAKVRPLTEREKAAHSGCHFMVIGGHRRLAGAKMAGLAALDCLVVDVSPEATFLAAVMDNSNEQMNWFDWDWAIEKLYLHHQEEWGYQQKLADQLGVSRQKVNLALTVMKVLTPLSRELIRHAVASEHGTWQITERPVLALAALEDPMKVEKALKVLIEKQMTEKQVKGLVAHIQAGGDPDQYKPGKKPPKGGSGGGGLTPSIETPEEKDKEEVPTPQKSGFWNALKQVWQGFAGAGIKAFFASGPKTQAEGQGLSAPIPKKGIGGKIVGSHVEPTHPSHGSRHVASTQGSKNPREALGQLICDFSRWAVTGLWQGFLWCLKKAWGLIKIAIHKAIHFIGKILGKVLGFILSVALVIALAYGLYLFFYHPAGLRGMLGRATSGVIHWVGSWVNPWEGDSKKVQEPVVVAPPVAVTVPTPTVVIATPVPRSQTEGHDLGVPISKSDMGTPVPTPEVVKTKHLKLKTSKSLKKAVPVAVVSNQNPTPKTENTAASSALPVAPATGQEAAWVAELIPAFPSPFLVKPLDLQPDPTISPLMVQKRLSEIQDPERFRVYVGHDRQTIKSMNVDDGGMDLFFNGSFGGLLGDSSSFRFFWEDVQGIRLATVEVSGDKPQTLCFCALEVKTKKKMAAFECAPGDVAHLVSALAAQFKSSTKREVLVAPLPYVNQGLWLGGQNQVDGMWWESPAGRSQEVKLRFTPADWQRPTTGGGIRLGDYLWGLGVNLNEQTGKEELFRQLGGMASGPATLFVVGPEDWRKAQNAETGPENDPFNPPRRAVRLPTP